MSVTDQTQTGTLPQRSSEKPARLYYVDWLRYGGETIMPFFVLHQPVIIAIAYFVVQWDTSTALGAGTGITLKLLVVVLGSLLVTLGLVELIIKRIPVLRGLFGMKTRRRETLSTEGG